MVNAPLYDESGEHKVGRIDVYCITTDPANEPNEKVTMAECINTYTLPGGKIHTQSVTAFPKLPAPPSSWKPGPTYRARCTGQKLDEAAGGALSRAYVAVMISTGEYDPVFDPFCGSGMPRVAAKGPGRFFVGRRWSRVVRAHGLQGRGGGSWGSLARAFQPREDRRP